MGGGCPQQNTMPTYCLSLYSLLSLLNLCLLLLWFMATYKCMGDKNTAIIEPNSNQQVIISACANLIKTCGKKKKNS